MEIIAGAESYSVEYTVQGNTGRIITPIFGVMIEATLLPPGSKVRLRLADPGCDPELATGEVTVPIEAVADAVQRPAGHPYGGLGHASFVDAAAVAAVVQMMAAG